MPPGGSSSPGITSSEPVENTATLTRRCTGSRASPTDAASATACGVRRSPAGSTRAPRAMSSPMRRTASPTRGTVLTTTSLPACSHSSCITTVSAPGGSGAPVKMRAAVPGASSWPTLPAGMRWLTGKRVPATGTSAARSA